MKLSSMKIDSTAVQNGEWISPGDEYDDMQLRVRGFTDAYFDSRNAKLRRAAVGFGGDQTKIPQAISRAITIECLVQHVFIDVRNLEQDGKPVTADDYKELMKDPDYAELVVAVLKSAGQVGTRRDADLKEALGNFQKPSSES